MYFYYAVVVEYFLKRMNNSKPLLTHKYSRIIYMSFAWPGRWVRRSVRLNFLLRTTRMCHLGKLLECLTHLKNVCDLWQLIRRVDRPNRLMKRADIILTFRVTANGRGGFLCNLVMLHLGWVPVIHLVCIYLNYYVNPLCGGIIS